MLEMYLKYVDSVICFLLWMVCICGVCIFEMWCVFIFVCMSFLYLFLYGSLGYYGYGYSVGKLVSNIDDNLM